MATIAITGSASGIGEATAHRLVEHGHRVIGIDLHDADIVCDLGIADGRAEAVAHVTEMCDGRLDGFVPCAGLAGSSTRPGPPLVSVNYFGTIALLEGLRAPLVAAGHSSVVCLSSNSTTCQPNWPVEIADACLAGDEEQARSLAARHGSLNTYPATKAALAWYVRRQAPEWAGHGVRLNAIAPGLVETPMTAELREDPLIGEAISMFPTPRGSGGRAEEVAAFIDFLLGPDSSLVIGSVLFVDGGTDAMLRARDWPAVWRIEGSPA